MAVALSVSVGMLVWFFWATHSAYLSGRLRPEFHRIEYIGSGSLKPEEIQPWMTFDYLNKTFNLPEDYLKVSLNITDKSYPNITIRHIVRELKTTDISYLNSVVKAVESYQSQK